MRFSTKLSLWLYLMAVISAPLGANPDQRPLWEVGVGLAAFQAPQYRGDQHDDTHVLPFPLLIYRGTFLNIDREGIRGLLFESDLMKFDISGNGSTAVQSDQTELRKGMPNLDYSFEIGPALDLILMKDKFEEKELGFSISLRGAFSTDFKDISHQGWTSNPHIYYIDERVGPKNLYFSFQAGPVFADERYHRFYYDVEPAYVTLERPIFQAEGGYSGFRTTVALSKTIHNIWIGTFIRFEHLDRAVYDDSPLIGKRRFVLAGFAVNYIISRSATYVDY